VSCSNTMLALLELLVAGSAAMASVAGPGPSCNCSTSRSEWGNEVKAITGKQHATSASDCCAQCNANDVCVMWEFAPETGACWLKRSSGGCTKKTGRVSGICGRPASGPPAPPPLPPPPPSTVKLNLAVDGHSAVAKTGDGFVSFTMDWWAPNQGASPEGWGDQANVLEVDLTSPKLRLLVKALGPAFLRIGGSLDKDVVYRVPGSMSEPCPHNSERGPVPGGGLCLNASRWDQLHEFCAATDSKLVFGLSYPINRHGTGADWNSSQAEALFAYSKQKGYTPATTMWGFELGEELTKFKVGTGAFEGYTASYQRGAKLLTSIFGTDSAARPKLMGPCPGMSWPQLHNWFPLFLKGVAGALDIAVYHSYNQIKVGSTLRRKRYPARVASRAPPAANRLAAHRRVQPPSTIRLYTTGPGGFVVPWFPGLPPPPPRPSQTVCANEARPGRGCGELPRVLYLNTTVPSGDL
jgi:hypothetical protein